MKKHFLVWL